MREAAAALESKERGRPQPLAAVAPAAQRRVAMTKVSWAAPADLDLAEWVEQGHRIGMMGRSAGWWIGDWLRYGNARYGEKYSRATKITGYDAQTLMNMVWVCSRIEISRRRENLSWSHHAEVAAVDLLLQERLLNQAAAERLSVRDLRELIRFERRIQEPDEPDAAAPDPARMVCPQCGFTFDEH